VARPTDPLIQKTMSKVVRNLASLRRREAEPVRAAILDLAAALIETVELSQAAPGTDSGSNVEGLQRWCELTAGVLESVTRSLSLVGDAERQDEMVTKLTTVARQLLEQTHTSNDDLHRLSDLLRSETTELTRKASEAGVLGRSLQSERLRLREDLRKAESAAEELDRVRQERRSLVDRIERQQATLELAMATAKKRRQFEDQVNNAKEVTAEHERELKGLRGQLAKSQEKLEALMDEHSTVEGQIERTRSLIADLESSSHHELLAGIREIWQRLPVDCVRGGV
jgi:predicted  nucleic acid-binding Zn-ribbon protein